MKLNLAKHRGFTLTELITVVGIITLLLSLSLVSIASARARARDARRVADLKLIQAALELYRHNETPYLDGYPYPVRYIIRGSSQLTGSGIYGHSRFPKYLVSTPQDPRKKNYVYFAPGCLHPGTGDVNNPTIVSAAQESGAAKILSVDKITGGPPGEYCPGGAGWMPYVLYTLLERGKKVAVFTPSAFAQPKQEQFADLASKDPKAVVYGPAPIFARPNGVIDDADVETWSGGVGSYCSSPLEGTSCTSGYGEAGTGGSGGGEGTPGVGPTPTTASAEPVGGIE